VRNPRTAATTDPDPAHDGPDVTTLLIELARLHGISEAAERSNHGIDDVPSDPSDPAQGKRPDRV